MQLLAEEWDGVARPDNPKNKLYQIVTDLQMEWAGVESEQRQLDLVALDTRVHE